MAGAVSGWTISARSPSGTNSTTLCGGPADAEAAGRIPAIKARAIILMLSGMGAGFRKDRALHYQANATKILRCRDVGILILIAAVSLYPEPARYREPAIWEGRPGDKQAVRQVIPGTAELSQAMPMHFGALATTASSVKSALPPVIEPRRSHGACPILLGPPSGPAADAAHW